MFSFWKKDEMVMTYYKIKLFNGAISRGASNELEAYLELCQTSKREGFWENSLMTTSY